MSHESKLKHFSFKICWAASAALLRSLSLNDKWM